MHFRKLISLWALLALMLGQVTLAQHSASHIDHGFTKIVSSHDGHDGHKHDDGDKKQECPKCLLTKSLQTAFYHAPSTFYFTPQTEIVALQQQSSVISFNRYKAHPPRAPPAALI